MSKFQLFTCEITIGSRAHASWRRSRPRDLHMYVLGDAGAQVRCGLAATSFCRTTLCFVTDETRVIEMRYLSDACVP